MQPFTTNPDQPFLYASIARLSPNNAHLVDPLPSITITSPFTFVSTSFFTDELSSTATTVRIFPKNFLFFPKDLNIESAICRFFSLSHKSAVLNSLIFLNSFLASIVLLEQEMLSMNRTQNTFPSLVFLPRILMIQKIVFLA